MNQIKIIMEEFMNVQADSFQKLDGKDLKVYLLIYLLKYLKYKKIGLKSTHLMVKMNIQQEMLIFLIKFKKILKD